MNKKMLFIFIVILLSVNSVCAIDNNDGSAFITKSEFDALKSSFQSQIDSYNMGIDSKIDGAIASYIGGIRISKEPINLWQNVKSSIGDSCWFWNSVPGSGSATVIPELSVVGERHYTYNKLTGIYSYFGTSYSTTYNRATYIKHNLQIAGASGTKGSSIFYAEKYWEQGDTTIWQEKSASLLPNFSYYGTNINSLGNEVKNVSNSLNVSSEGSGSGFIFHTNPNGSKTLREYASSFWPMQIVECQCHTYKNFGDKTKACIQNYYMKDNGMGDTGSTFLVNIDDRSEYGEDSYGTRVSDGDATPSNTYWKHTITQIKTTDLIDYSVAQWGKGSDNFIYVFEDNQNLEMSGSSTLVNVPESNFYSIYYTNKADLLQTNKLSGITLNYKKVSLTPTRVKMNDFLNDILSTVGEEDVKIGGGAPIAKAVSAGQNIKIKLTFKCVDGSGNPINDKVYYKVSDKQFVDGNFAPGATAIASGEASTVSTAGNHNVEFIITSKSENDIYWINMYANTTGNRVTIDTINLE